MCTMIVTQVPINGSGNAADGWFRVRAATVSDAHPFHAPFAHAPTSDVVKESLGPGARVVVEPSVAGARAMGGAINAVLERADAGGYLEQP